MHKPKLRKLDREQRRKLPKNKRNGSSEFFRVSRSKIVISLGTVTKLKCSEHSRQKDSFMFKNETKQGQQKTYLWHSVLIVREATTAFTVDLL